MRTIIDFMKTLPWIIFGGLFIIFSFPFMLIAQPFIWFGNRRFAKEYSVFLGKMDGKNFFCYNNKKKSKNFIEERIIPLLSDSIEVVYLNGSIPESSYKRKYISFALRNLKDYHGFPHLIKIRDSQTVDKSCNQDLFNSLNQGKPINLLLEKIDGFFSDKSENEKQH